jgi:hypothetical protein
VLVEVIERRRLSRPVQRLASRFRPAARTLVPERNGEQWVTRSVARNGVVCVGWQQVSVGKNYSGSACDLLVSAGEIRTKRAQGTATRTGMGAKWDISTGSVL